MKKTGVLSSLFLLFVSTSPAYDDSLALTDEHPFGAGQTIGCFASGTAAGGLLGGAIGALSYYTFTSDEDQDNISGTTGFIVGGLLGYTVGNALGVYGFGRISDETGSFKATLVGSALGLMAGGLGLLASERWFAHPNDGSNDTISGTILFAAPPLGATIAFLVTRRNDPPESASENALINLERGRFCLGAPTLSFRFDGSSSPILTKRVTLLRALY